MRWVACIGIWLVAATLVAQPSLRFALPTAVAPSEKTQVTFFGDKLTNVTQLWTSWEVTSTLAGNIPQNGQLDKRVIFDIQPPANARVGIYGTRIGTKQGCSDLCPLMVDDLPTVNENGKNKSRETAQAITWPVAIDGVYEAESYDFYQFTAKAGQAMTFEVVAQRIGSPFDSMLRILDATSEQELAFSDDVLGTDSLLRFEPKTDGTYLLEVRDVRFQGNGNSRYRLRVGDFPAASVCMPLAVQRGVETNVQLWGSQSQMPTIATVREAADSKAKQVWLNATGPSGKGSAFLPLLVSDVPEIVEQEPNNQVDQAKLVSLPAGLNGRFQTNGDVDHFRFEAQKGKAILFTGMGRALGSPVDLVLKILDSTGRQLAQVDDSGTDEGELSFSPPADGIYSLAVEDLTGNGGPAYSYRVQAKFLKPTFSLTLQDPANNNALVEKRTVPQGGLAQITVQANRRGYNGEIEILLDGVPESVQLTKNIIREGKPSTTLSAKFPDDLPAGSLLAVKVVGKATIDKESVTIPADLSNALIPEFANSLAIPAQLSHHLGLGIGPEFPSFFTLSPQPKYLTAPSGIASTVRLKISTQRTKGFQDPIQLTLTGLPEGVTVKAPAIDKGKNESVLEFSIPATLPNGKYSLELAGSGTFQFQPQQVQQSLSLYVSRPLTFSVQPLGNLTQQGKQKLRVVVNRLSAVDQPISFRLNDLPPGVVVAGTPTLAPNQNVLEIEVAANGQAAKGTFPFTVTAATKIQNQNYEIESLPIEWQIQ